jgi:hypothetical protein
MTMSRWSLLRMKNVLNKSCRENQNTHLCYVSFFRKLHRLRENVEKCDGARGATNDVTTWRIRVACWMSKATRTLVLPDAHAPGHPHLGMRTHTHTNRYTYCFPRQQRFRERASTLRYTYIACLLSPYFSFPLLVIPPVMHTRPSSMAVRTYNRPVCGCRPDGPSLIRASPLNSIHARYHRT